MTARTTGAGGVASAAAGRGPLGAGGADLVLCAEGLSCGYGGVPAVRDVSFSVAAGQVLCLLGPNGAGKSTLLKTVLGLLPPLGGRLLFGGSDTARWARARRARAMGYVPQSHVGAFPFTVREVVLMGRTAQLGMFSAVRAADEEISERALDDAGVAPLAGRDYTTLSGGERQLVLIARALAQQAQVLVMDEPTASLDFGNRARVLDLVRALASAGRSVVMTTHDPDHAFLTGGDVGLLRPGGGFELGPAAHIITAQTLREVYGVRAAVVPVADPEGGGTVACVPFQTSPGVCAWKRP